MQPYYECFFDKKEKSGLQNFAGKLSENINKAGLMNKLIAISFCRGLYSNTQLRTTSSNLLFPSTSTPLHFTGSSAESSGVVAVA